MIQYKDRQPTYKTYKFDELSEDSQQLAIEKNCCINVDHDWYQYDGLICDPAILTADVESFNIENGRDYVHFTRVNIHDENAFLLLLKIPYYYRKYYKSPDKFTGKMDYFFVNNSSSWPSTGRSTEIRFAMDDKNGFYEDYMYGDTASIDNSFTDKQNDMFMIATEKWDDLMANAVINLRKEYEYLTSAEQIAESLRTNDYDFDSSGCMLLSLT